MKDLLIHTSKIKIDDFLLPNKVPGFKKPFICLSLNLIVSYFGEYIYLFEKEELIDNFHIEIIPSGGVELQSTIFLRMGEHRFRFKGQDLGEEFRIYEPISIQRFCLGRITNFNHMRGILEERFMDEMIRRKMDFDERG